MRKILAAVLALTPLPAAAAPTAADFLACEATATLFQNLLDRWEAEGRGSAEPAKTNVEALREALSLGAVYLAVGTEITPGAPRLDALRQDVVAARERAADAVRESLAENGLDATFTALSQRLRACEETLKTLEAELEAAPPR